VNDNGIYGFECTQVRESDSMTAQSAMPEQDRDSCGGYDKIKGLREMKYALTPMRKLSCIGSTSTQVQLSLTDAFKSVWGKRIRERGSMPSRASSMRSRSWLRDGEKVANLRVPVGATTQGCQMNGILAE